MLYPLTFHPVYQERIWGGRNLERLYGKELPPGRSIGESWEISDRPEGMSVVAQGAMAGKTLRWLVENRRDELLGPAKLAHGRFPLLIKILDAQERLSLQVHPPESVAAELGGEPKTEMWYMAQTEPGAEIFVGLKRGGNRAEFERRLQDGTVVDCFHHLLVRAGDAMFLPSGRVHAIGGGNVIFEVQQNSDTTFRVFDWNRIDAAGKRRALHIAESLQSIDFSDFEPSLIESEFLGDKVKLRDLVVNRLFSVHEYECAEGMSLVIQDRRLLIFGVVSGRLLVDDGRFQIRLEPGQFCLIPACVDQVALKAVTETRFLQVIPGS